jgi:hypothetical protein
MWVDNITFNLVGKNLRVQVKVTSESGAVGGAQLGMKLTCSRGNIWDLTGTTNSGGIASFTVQKPPAGDYVATVASLSGSGYFWDTSRGVTSDSYTLDNSSRSTGKK